MLIRIGGNLYNDKHMKAIEEFKKTDEDKYNPGMSYLKNFWYDDDETSGDESEILGATINDVYYPIKN